MAESVVSFVGQTLADLLAQEVKILLEVREKVEQMQNELEKMKRFLKDADRRQDKDETVRNWVSEIREAAYDAEAVIETFAVKIASIRRGGIQNAVKRYACIVNEAKEIQKVNSRIEYIKTKIAELGQDKRIYTIAPENECSTLDKQLGQVFPHVKDSPVGLDRDVKILVAQLVNEDKHCQFFSVCGMGGLGKTTLAKEVFHHSEIRHHFDAVAWASVSQQCNRRNVWEEILINLVLDIKQRTSDKQRKAIRQYTDLELAAELCRVQQVNKCLMILDDLWTEKAWDILKPAFSLRKGGSKILLTTRNKKVARHVHPGVFVHEPECLAQEEGWQLLQREVLRIFPGFQINSYIEESGKEMVGICGGLPLAIIELGRLLLEKEHTLNGWKTVHSNFKEREGHEQQQRRVFEELALSYHELPYQLKPCFLHLGHFPKDFDIPTKKLIRIWVAEGIVSPIVEGVETMEDVGEQYLSELVDRCMVQVFRFWFIVTERDLRKLLAECHHLHKLYLDGQILKLPKYEEIPQTITKLTLCNSKLKEDPMATLEKLPDLKILRLKCEAFIGKKMVCSLRGFPQLKSLVLSDLPNLEEWLVGEEAMPNLCELVIESCPGLRIINMPAEFKNRLQVGGGGLD
ncbi:hypothetical protein L1049_015267 [Liquidambar formosana]|uniref:Disease resistance protein n=1 Tax=Liquidambar formosana TaxID=63359 RepID=A0AAP0S3E4_LIQFO